MVMHLFRAALTGKLKHDTLVRRAPGWLGAPDGQQANKISCYSVSAKSTKARKATKQRNVAPVTCPGCGILEGSVAAIADKQLSCDWLACRDCKTRYHEHSAENHGILDDEHFLYKCCV